MVDYPKTKFAGTLNILTAFISLIAGAVIAYLLFFGEFQIVPDGEEGFANLAMIVVVPITLIHLLVYILSFLTHLFRGLRLKAAANSGSIRLASYIVTLIFKLIYRAANAFAIYVYFDVKIGGMIAVIATAAASFFLLITMIVEFSTRHEILDE